MNRYNLVAMWWIMLLFAVVVMILPACGKSEQSSSSQEVILEPGIKQDGSGEPVSTPIETEAEDEPVIPAEEEGGFVDQGRASTIENLMSNKSKIMSYYFEQTINASYGDIFIKTWYADGWMKIVSIAPYGEENTEYVDYENSLLIEILSSPSGYIGKMSSFKPGDPDIPNNYVDTDYHQFRIVDNDNIDGQTCRVLESRQGEKRWVSTKYGFPVQVEFNDPTNDEHFIISFDNLTFNEVSYEDIAIPDDIDIIAISDDEDIYEDIYEDIAIIDDIEIYE